MACLVVISDKVISITRGFKIDLTTTNLPTPSATNSFKLYNIRPQEIRLVHTIPRNGITRKYKISSAKTVQLKPNQMDQGQCISMNSQ